MKKQLFRITLTVMLITLMFAVSVSAADQSVKNGVVEDNGITRIYKKGKLVKNTYGIKVKGAYYTVDKKGIAKEVSEAEGLAGIQLEKIGKGKTKAATLKKAFNWSSSKISYGTVKKPSGKTSAADYYAVIGFKRKKGNCYVMAAVFYQMARVLGYDAKFVAGKVPAQSGKLAEHSWVTIKEKGKTYVYDPNFAWVYHTKTKNSKAASGFKMTYTKKKNSKLGQYRYYTTKGKLLK